MAQRDTSRQRVTIKDVAEAAGVSRSTASRALTGRGYVAEEVRQRVQSAATRLGYVADALARSLKQRHSPVIGVLVSDLSNPFYAELAAGAARRAREKNLGVMLADTAGESDAERSAAELFVSMRVAGVLVTPVGPQVTTYLASARVPTVEVDRYFAPQLADSVTVSNTAGARDVTDHLLRLGHRNIVMLIDEASWTTGRDRIEGFRRAHEAHGLKLDDSNVVTTGWNSRDAALAATSVLARRERPTAIFTTNNVLAEGAWRAIHAAGLRIPEDVSLCTFDEAQWMTMVTPEITAVSQNAHHLGDAAAALLLERIAEPDRAPQPIELETTLVHRASVGPAPGLPCDPGGTRPERR
ncbi:hypothetical protein BW733_03360 [Tessaracoccus flavescens]|uniref:HTH lacI-type domain-containing protein n=1 Tax=Tessaracoccus flavescens TaxID=399497 RepID=A0A1Q2CV90_9ACTN|nr:hypothetical protein BW733_03360 [Tessaracoccus flavescens]